MAAGPIHEHTHTGVYIYKKDRVFITSISDELDDQGVDHALVFRWNQTDWVHWPITTAVGSVCVIDQPQIMVMAMGINGEIHIIKAPPNEIEQVDATNEGPSDLLHLKCIRPIGTRVYVAGMARRVYRREVAGLWNAIDAGVFVPRAQRNRGV